MPFENEEKIPFKDMPVCDQQEIIHTLSGKYDDRELWCYDSIEWGKAVNNLDRVFLDCPYKVVQKDIFVYVEDGYLDTKIINYSINKLRNIPQGKYKLVKIED